MASGREPAGTAIRPPQQERSERTLARLVEGARKILESRSLEQTTVSEIARSAGLSVGAVYSRFPDKRAFLRYLQDESYGKLQEAYARLHGAGEEPGGTLEEALRTFIAEMARLYRKNRGAMRSLLLESWTDPGHQKRRMAFTSDVIGRTVVRLLNKEGPPEHPRPEAALRIAMHMATSALREAILFDETWWRDGSGAGSHGALVSEVTAAVLAYLKIPRRPPAGDTSHEPRE